LLYALFAALRSGNNLFVFSSIIALCFSIGLLLLICSTLLPNFNLGISAFHRGPSGRKWVALTFDDGPHEPYTSEILDILKEYKVPATFFFLGRNVERHPEVVKRVLQEGHPVGNHTFDHRPLVFMSKREIEKELEAWEKAMEKAGQPAFRLFRAPRGWKSPFLNSVLKQRGYRLVGWTRGVWDTDCPGVPVLYERLTRKASNGEIILLHDGGDSTEGADRSQTVGVLRSMIGYYQNLGFQFVTIPQMMSEA
jgi:peptidoglycan/xylan/chitin deacetylase (PgdA/CDA1 family)